MADGKDTRELVRARYAAAAINVLDGAASGGCGGASAVGSCCGPAAAVAEEGFGSNLYDAGARAELPAAAAEASLGCGNPLTAAQLNPSETVLDLGSRAGIDVLLPARRVRTTGQAFAP